VGGAVALGMAPILPFAAFATMAPLAAYTTALAFFGLPHVLSELRYVDRRFGRRLCLSYLAPIAALLAVIVAARACVVFGAAPARCWRWCAREALRREQVGRERPSRCRSPARLAGRR
jgi:hypothetical protein